MPVYTQAGFTPKVVGTLNVDGSAPVKVAPEENVSAGVESEDVKTDKSDEKGSGMNMSLLQ